MRNLILLQSMYDYIVSMLKCTYTTCTCTYVYIIWFFGTFILLISFFNLLVLPFAWFGLDKWCGVFGLRYPRMANKFQVIYDLNLVQYRISIVCDIRWNDLFVLHTEYNRYTKFVDQKCIIENNVAQNLNMHT